MNTANDKAKRKRCICKVISIYPSPWLSRDLFEFIFHLIYLRLQNLVGQMSDTVGMVVETFSKVPESVESWQFSHRTRASSKALQI
jgi:hypothetical protein